MKILVFSIMWMLWYEYRFIFLIDGRFKLLYKCILFLLYIASDLLLLWLSCDTLHRWIQLILERMNFLNLYIHVVRVNKKLSSWFLHLTVCFDFLDCLVKLVKYSRNLLFVKLHISRGMENFPPDLPCPLLPNPIWRFSGIYYIVWNQKLSFPYFFFIARSIMNILGPWASRKDKYGEASFSLWDTAKGKSGREYFPVKLAKNL